MSEIYKEKLENGVTVLVTDKSRQVAGDRWYIKLLCTATMPVKKEMIKVRADDDPELFAMIRKHIGKNVRKDFIQERNFVDEQEKNDVIGELLARLDDNIKGYLASEKFPARFLDRCYEEARTTCLAIISQPTGEQAVDDDAPADFSSCFRD